MGARSTLVRGSKLTAPEQVKAVAEFGRELMDPKKPYHVARVEFLHNYGFYVTQDGRLSERHRNPERIF